MSFLASDSRMVCAGRYLFAAAFALALVALLHGQSSGIRALGQIAIIDDPSLVGSSNFFDLNGRSLRFVPNAGGGYTVVNEPAQWESEVGTALSYEPGGMRDVVLNAFTFPFAGNHWSVVTVRSHGSVTFGWREETEATRFTRNVNLALSFAGGPPIIAPLYRRGFTTTSPSRTFVRQLGDRLVVTWDVTESYGSALSFYREPNTNRFQLVLRSSGEILFTYAHVDTRDGIVGVFPGPRPFSVPVLLTHRTHPTDATLAPHLDITESRMEQIDSVAVRVSYRLRGAVGAPASGVEYRFYVDLEAPFATGPTIPIEDRDCIIRIFERQGQWAAAHCSGATNFGINGDAVWMDLPLTVIGSTPTFQWAGDAVDFMRRDPCCWFDRAEPAMVSPTVVPIAPIDFSAAGSLHQVGPVFEIFHYPVLNEGRDTVDGRSQEVAQRFYSVFEDSYDFLVLMTTFRFDSQEPGGSYSLDARPGNIQGLGQSTTNNTAAYGSNGVLTGGVAPTWLNAPMFDPVGAGPLGAFSAHGWGLWLITHEVGHTWLARLEYLKGGGRHRLFDESGHWRPEVHAPSAFSIRGDTDKSPMGGGVWIERAGTLVNVGSANYVPSGYSHLDLYAMGLLAPASVPPFFVAENNARTPVSIDEVIAAMGPRIPSGESAKRAFAAAFVLVTLPGVPPTPAELDRIDSVRRTWEVYFAAATGGLGSVSTVLRRRMRPFADDPLVPGSTVVRAAHIAELRSRIDGARIRYGLPPFSYSDPQPTPGVTVVLARHVSEMRSALAQVYHRTGRQVPEFSDSSLAGVTVRAAHIAELRHAVVTVE